VSVSDLRLQASITADAPGFETSFELMARDHVFEFSLADGQATVRMRSTFTEDGWDARSVPFELPAPGRVFNVEFWHVDQRMAIYIDGELIVQLLYDWSPLTRLEAIAGMSYSEALDSIERMELRAARPDLTWRFSGATAILERVRVDRDLHYRMDMLKTQDQRNEPRFHGPGFAIHPDLRPAVLGTDYYMMLGDNSTASLDSRLWGSAHRLVRHQIIDAAGNEHEPFLVHEKLLIGKAFAVYFPAPFPVVEGGWGVIPDFGRLRFIR